MEFYNNKSSGMDENDDESIENDPDYRYQELAASTESQTINTGAELDNPEECQDVDFVDLTLSADEDEQEPEPKQEVDLIIIKQEHVDEPIFEQQQDDLMNEQKQYDLLNERERHALMNERERYARMHEQEQYGLMDQQEHWGLMDEQQPDDLVDEQQPDDLTDEQQQDDLTNEQQQDDLTNEQQQDDLTNEQQQDDLINEQQQEDPMREQQQENLALGEPPDAEEKIDANVESLTNKSSTRPRRRKNPFIAFFLSMYRRRPRKRVTEVARQAGRQWCRMSDRQRKRYADIAAAEEPK